MIFIFTTIFIFLQFFMRVIWWALFINCYSSNQQNYYNQFSLNQNYPGVSLLPENTYIISGNFIPSRKFQWICLFFGDLTSQFILSTYWKEIRVLKINHYVRTLVFNKESNFICQIDVTIDKVGESIVWMFKGFRWPKYAVKYWYGTSVEYCLY